MDKIIAFDVFNTVVRFDGVAIEEIRDYVHHIKQPYWSPLHLPDTWYTLPAYKDAELGLQRLRQRFLIVTCSNAPLGLQARLLRHNYLTFDAIIPLEYNRVFKPDPRAYMTVCDLLNVQPRDVLMVTANKDFGDLEAAVSVGMSSILIREPGGEGPRDIIELAERMGC